MNPHSLNSSPESPLAASSDAARFGHATYEVRRKVLKLIGASFYVHDPSDNIILYANQKAFKLKEDIRLYESEAMTREFLVIKARSILDFGATYDVTDATTGEKLGALRRKALQSMIQDEWTILDAQDREMGAIKEESLALALIRRFIDMATLFLPQSYNLTVGSRAVGRLTQTRNPLLMRVKCDFSSDNDRLLDRRLGLATAVLLCAIEGRQA